MGLDMRPIGKPKPGFEKRYLEIFKAISENEVLEPSLIDKLRGKKFPTKEEFFEEWYAIQITTYETIKAPRVGRDKVADLWIRERYEELERKPPLEEFLKDYDGYYVIELAKEKDGVPVYFSLNQDENVFRGKFLEECVDLIGEDLVAEAWNSKQAMETLEYGKILMEVADRIAKQNCLEYLKEQRFPPDSEEETIELKLHIVYALAKWLIFYGKNGHGYEADY